jgi:beta-lactam-binding protein with PASTA domain
LQIKRFAVLSVKYALLALALLLTAGLSALTTMRVVLTSQEVVVPSLVNKRVSEAGVLATRSRLSLQIEGRRNDPRVLPDRIVAQEPAPGSTLKSQRSIRVWVSLGPRRLTVPAVEGDSVRTGRLSLEQAQVPVGRVVEVADASEEGTILMQHPPPGETDTLGADGASLLVSVGPIPRNSVLPDLIGKPASQVLDRLRVAGLKVTEVRYRSYPGVPAGMVLRQVPAAGFRVSPRSSVSLDISKGAE